MPINPKFLEAREREQRNRVLAHILPQTLLRIPLRHGGEFAAPMQPLTERTRLELSLAGNAFFAGRAPLLGDVFMLLWRHHPEFCRPQLDRAAFAADLRTKRLRFLRLWFAFGSFAAAVANRHLASLVRRCDLPGATRALHAWLATADQDAEEAAPDGTHRSRLAPPPCWPDQLVAYFTAHCHLTPQEALDLPVAVVNQHFRHRALSAPDGEINVIDPSDALLGASS
jgi:hypothetical protein